MSTKDLAGRTALVTGASSGLGTAFARLLAARGADLVITARREANLTALAEELRAAHGIGVTTIVLDLAEPGSAARLFAETEGAGRAVDVLINNAGGGIHRNFVDIPWEETARQIQLNVTSLTELTWRFARAMVGRGRGWVLNVSSIGAYTPSPTYATYSAGKAYVRDFSEAVAYELKDTPVRVCSLCPGLTRTEFHQAARHTPSAWVAATSMSAESVAAIGLRAVFAGRRNVVAGWLNKAVAQSMRLTPRPVMTWSAALSMGKPRREE
jgi:short-subunit dehydrogenase